MTNTKTQIPTVNTAKEMTDKEKEVIEQQFFVFWRNGEGTMERGPLPVLWDMIESYQVDIFDVSLERLTEDFLSYMKESRKLRIDIAASFIHMAARLVYYKSRALLPDVDFITEHEEENRLPKEIVQQLLEYRKYQMAAEKLCFIENLSSGMQGRKAGIHSVQITPMERKERKERKEREGWLDLNLTDLIILYSRLLKRIEKEQQKEKDLTYELEKYSVEEKIKYLSTLIEKVDTFSFEEIFENPYLQNVTRNELIVTFLALLELTLQGKIILRQKHNFQEVLIFKRNVIVT